MRLDNIKLNNFGIYHDKVNLDLSINNNNIILIGGENGAGKTTLLNAIKICLYGSISMGYKTNTEDYLDYIKDFYNYSAENNNHNKMSINLKLLLNYKGNKIPFELKRSWDPDNDFKESFFIKDLSENKVIPSADFEDYFNNVFPPSLFDFFIFDGELVNDMLYKKEFNVIFKKAVKTILNLNLPETIINDLEKIQKNKINNNFSKIENEYTEIKFEYQSIKSEIKEMKSNLEDINTKIKNLISEKNKLEKLFNDKGGIHANKRQKLKNQIKELEDQKSKVKDKVDNLADTHLPFFINKDMLNKIKNQLDTESGFKTYHEFQNNIWIGYN
jgi:DNA sulfur modification protein DndD